MQTWKPNLITRIATTLMVLPMAFNSPAKANTMEDHARLLNTVQNAGVMVKINPDECDEDDNAYGWFGTYPNGQQELVVCQVNKITGVSEMVRWDAEDLDTIRHEAHHLVQDCMDRVRDGSLTAVYRDPIGLGNSVIGEGKVREVARIYRERGGHIIVMEIEAFAVAAMNDPAEQVRDIQRYCM